KARLHLKHIEGDSTSLHSGNPAGILEDAQGYLWVVHSNGVIEKIDANSLKVVYRNYSLFTHHRGVVMDYRFILDLDNHLWIYIADTNRGIVTLNTTTNTLQHTHKRATTLQLNNDIIRRVVCDNNNMIWIATDHGGLTLIDKQQQTIQYILHSPEDEHSLSENSVNTLYRDDDGIIWAGTFKEGISYYHENIIRFRLYKNNPFVSQSLPFDDINAFAEDDKGN